MGMATMAAFKDRLRTAWRAIFGQWLHESGFQVDNRPCFERYLPEQLASEQGQRFACDICIPVVPL